MIPRIDSIISNKIEIVAYPSFTYKLTDINIVGDIDNLDALKQAIYHRVLTERYAYAIYDENYGAELQQYIGRSFAFLEATIENTLKDSLLQDDRITDVRVTSIKHISNTDKNYYSDAALVEFDVYTNMGIIGIMGIEGVKIQL